MPDLTPHKEYLADSTALYSAPNLGGVHTDWGIRVTYTHPANPGALPVYASLSPGTNGLVYLWQAGSGTCTYYKPYYLDHPYADWTKGPNPKELQIGKFNLGHLTFPLYRVMGKHLATTLADLLRKKQIEQAQKIQALKSTTVKEKVMSNNKVSQLASTNKDEDSSLVFKAELLPGTMQFFADKNLQSQSISLYGWGAGDIGQYNVLCPANMEERDHGDQMEEPFMRISYAAAQTLMQALWDTGIRPMKASTAEVDMVPKMALDKVEMHLEDMRMIAMGFVKTATDLKQ